MNDDWQQPGFHIHRSNCMEALADLFVELIANQGPHDPFATECVVINSRGMESWLKQWTASHSRDRISCNIRFPFVNSLVSELLKLVEPMPETENTPTPDHYQRETLQWRILEFLLVLENERREDDTLDPLRQYITPGSRPQLRAFQLAGRLAGLFDHYQVYRPEMLRDWENEDARLDLPALMTWQPVLWRYLRERLPGTSRMERMLQFCELPQPDAVSSGIHRVSLFGINTLPPTYVQLFTALSRSVPIHLFWLSPSSEEIMYMLTDRERTRAEKRLRISGVTPDQFDLYIGKGNRLLESWGGLGRDFLRVLADETELNGREDFRSMSEGSLLGVIQNDILLNRYVGTNELTDNSREPIPIDPGDMSIEIHGCHTRMREVEVLKDNLFRYFAHDPSLQPRDVLVMAPDISEYAPYIDAVFGGHTDPGTPYITYTVADQNMGQESPIIKTFLTLLSLTTARFKASEILDLLAVDAVREAVQLTEEDLTVVRDLALKAGVHWGRDTDHRESLAMPGFTGGTWQTGIDQMLLGYAMERENSHGVPHLVADGLLPVAGIDGDMPRLVGTLGSFLDRLRTFTKLTAQSLLPGTWAAELRHFADDFFQSDERTYLELRALNSVLEKLENLCEASEFNRPVTIDVVADFVRTNMAETVSGHGFFRGKLTFCSMLPMRSIPVRVICLLGLNDTAFPRRDPRLGFDLMARSPKAGDRSRRQDDRYMFLEAVLSARSRLTISYLSRSATENTRQPPSGLVAELRDYIEQAFVLPEGHVSNFDPEEKLLFCETEHRMQPFNREYFNRSRPHLHSFSARGLAAAEALHRSVRETPLLFPLDPDGKPARALPLQADDPLLTADAPSLARFFRNPCHFLARERLGVRPERELAALPDNEMLCVDPLSAHGIDQQVLSCHLRGVNEEESYHLLNAQGLLPQGAEGRHVLQQREAAVASFLGHTLTSLPDSLAEQTVRDMLDAPPETILLPPRQIAFENALDTAGELCVTVEGTASLVCGHCQLIWRYANIKPKDRITACIQHLVVCQALPELGITTLLLGKGDGGPAVQTLEPLDPQDAADMLETLLVWYVRGLRTPLPFLPDVSFPFAEKLAKKPEAVGDAFRAAATAWHGSFGNPAYSGVGDYINTRFFDDEGPMSWNEFGMIANDILSVILRVEEGRE